MSRKSRSNLTPEQLLADYPPNIRELAGELRRRIKSLLPEAEERVYPVWRGIGYRHPAAGYLGAIFPQQEMVKLGLEHGAQLPDPANILKPGPTGGRQVRYVEIAGPEDINREALAALLMAALALQQERRRRQDYRL